MIKVLTDSASNMPPHLVEEYGIRVLSLSIIMEGREIWEMEVSNREVYEYVDQTNKLPETMPLRVNELTEAFEEEIEAGNRIIGIFISSNLSDTFKNAVTAKERLLARHSKASITLIDSKNMCMAQGLAVLAAAKKVKEGAWLEDAVTAAEETIRRTNFIFVPNGLKYVMLSGRISKLQSILGNAMQLTPILKTKDGFIVPHDQVISRNRAVQRMVETFKNDVAAYGIKNVSVQHVEAEEIAVKVVEQTEDISGLETIISAVGAAIGIKTGPGIVGIAYETMEAPVE